MRKTTNVLGAAIFVSDVFNVRAGGNGVRGTGMVGRMAWDKVQVSWLAFRAGLRSG